MHTALKWIISKQGYRNDKMIIVAWENEAKSNNIPKWNDNIFDFFENNDKIIYSTGNKYDINDFKEALNGYRRKLNNMSKMTFMELESPSTGRVSIKYYSEMPTKKYIDNIEKWHTQGSWKHSVFISGKKSTFEGIPAPDKIIDYAYGSEQDGKSISLKNDSFKSSAISRLLPCIVESRKLPRDIMEKLVEKASNPMSYEKVYNWEAVLTAACSLLKKYRKERFKEDWNMALDVNSRDRNYLYGRLLALADKIERDVQYLKEGKERITNAKRYTSAFSQHPFRTWMIIEEKVNTYLQELKGEYKVKYEKLLNEIYDKFEIQDYTDNKKLNGLYLLGYHSQMMEFYKKKEEKEDEQ